MSVTLNKIIGRINGDTDGGGGCKIKGLAASCCGPLLTERAAVEMIRSVAPGGGDVKRMTMSQLKRENNTEGRSLLLILLYVCPRVRRQVVNKHLRDRVQRVYYPQQNKTKSSFQISTTSQTHIEAGVCHQSNY